MEHTETFDVIVVGGGGSGLATAVSAAICGGRVLLLEKEARLGGATGIAVGSVTANQTRLQEQAGIADSLEAHAADAAKFAPPEIEARNNDELRRWFLSHSAGTLHWLMDMGLNFYGPNPEPPNRVERMHNVIPGAQAFINVLQARFLRVGGEVRVQARVTSLLQENGAVVGVEYDHAGQRRQARARQGVVLACGDYANSPEVIRRFKGEAFGAIEGISTSATGEGHLLAEAAGAQLVNMDVTYGPELRFIAPSSKTFQQFLPTRGPLARLMGALVPYVPQFLMTMMIQRLLVTWQHPENALFDDGAILVNQNGERFCDERAWPARELAIARQPGKLCYIVLDGRLIEKYNAWPHFISTAPKIGHAYVKDYLRLRPDVAAQAPQLAQAAAKRRIPVDTLQTTLAAVNHTRAGGDLPPLVGGPWAVLGPAKAYFTTTEGGAAINTHFQVLDAGGQPIPGLYAVGQTGLGGQILWGHGLHIAWAITSGRLLGEQLAEAAVSKQLKEPV